MTLRIPKKGTGSAWSANFWTPEDHPAIPLLLSLAPATRRWLFGVPGAGVGFFWTRTDYPGRDTDAQWEVGDRSLTLFAATGSHDHYGLPLPDDADVDRALWLPENPWSVLEALYLAGIGLERRCGEPLDRAYLATHTLKAGAVGATAIEAVLKLADLIVGGKP